VTPSRALLRVIGTGGFHPDATSLEMSAFSRASTSLPSASRTWDVGGTSGFE